MGIVVLALSLIRAAYDIFGTATKTTDPLPAPLGCAVESTSSINDSFFIASVVCSSVADAIVLLVTWCRTYHTIRATRQKHERPTLSFLLWRDGTVYFGSLFIIAILDMAIYTAVSFQGFQYLRLAFSTIILSRFFLNLRKASQGSIGGTVSTFALSTHIGTLHFSQGIDTLGGSLTFIGDNDAVRHDACDNRLDDEASSDEVSEEEGCRAHNAVSEQADM